MTRPLAHAKIDELEQIFEKAIAEGDDAKVGEVAHELTNRNQDKPRNQRLADAAKRYLEEPEPPEDADYVREAVDYDDPAHWVSDAAEEDRTRAIGSGSESETGTETGDDLPPPSAEQRAIAARAERSRCGAPASAGCNYARRGSASP